MKGYKINLLFGAVWGHTRLAKRGRVEYNKRIVMIMRGVDTE